MVKEQVSSGIFRNIGGERVFLELTTTDPFSIKLDITNPRIAYSLEQLTVEERNDAACELLLSTQEDVDRLKRSIRHTSGVQEPIYLTHTGIVVEGNRRVVALRELKREYPENVAFAQIPAWVIPSGTPSIIVEDLINAAHLDPKRPWAPFERALVLKRLNEEGLDSGTLADRYEMNRSEVKLFIEAAELMMNVYIPLLPEPHDPQVISKFSYFLEFVKGRMTEYRRNISNLDEQFCTWVCEGKIPRAEAVRSLPKVLDSNVAFDVLRSVGFKEAMATLTVVDPSQDRFYNSLLSLTRHLEHLGTNELYEIQNNQEKKQILCDLNYRLNLVLSIIDNGKGDKV